MYPKMLGMQHYSELLATLTKAQTFRFSLTERKEWSWRRHPVWPLRWRI